MKIHHHLHSGEIIKNIINRMNLSITEMAVRLSIFFGNSIEMWINLQSNFEAWKS